MIRMIRISEAAKIGGTKMKKIFAIALVVVLVFAMASVAFAAGNPVVSPEKQNTSPSVVPGGKTSPQTGESFSVAWVVMAALILLAVALFCGKKLISVK